MIDLSTTGFKMPVDVRTVKRSVFQVTPGSGNPSGAAVEVRRAFDGLSNTPARPFSPAVTLDMSGDSVTPVDCTNTGWLHLICTTAASGVTIDTPYTLSGRMEGETMVMRVDTDTVGDRAPVAVAEAFKAFVLAEPFEPVTTAELEIKHAAAIGAKALSFDPAADLTIDGQTITELDASESGAFVPHCGAAQPGQLANLYWYIRGEVFAES